MKIKKLLSCITSFAIIISMLSLFPVKIKSHIIAEAANNETVIWPVPGYNRITSRFGWRDLNGDGINEDHHQAIDIGCPKGTNVLAVASGTVALVQNDSYNYGMGLRVVIYHGDSIYTGYQHLSEILVKEGDTVSQGDVIARSGNSGGNYAAHLDFHVKMNSGDDIGSVTNHFNKDPLDNFLPYEGYVSTNGETVYISSSAYTFGNPPPNEWTTDTAGQYTTKNVNTNLNIRSSPSTSSSVVGKVPAGATVNVIKTKGSWAYIEYNGTNGYCSLDYLERTSPLSSGMRIEDKTEPIGRLEPGKFFAVKGMIYSNMPITRVWGGVYNRDWTPTKQWTEAFPGTTTYDLSKHFDNSIIFNNLDVGYYYYRIEATDDSGNVYPLCDSEFQIGDPPPIVWYNGLAPVNLGDTFDALILAKEPWITIRANSDSNVILHPEEWEASEMWRFVRQSDGSYTIQNFANGKFLDAEGLGTTNGTNVFTCEGNGGENQKWFLYDLNGGYVIRAAYSDMVLDVNGGVWDSGTNIQMYEHNDSAAQTFSLYYVESNYGTPGKGTLSATVSDNTIALTISHSTYADSYELYRSTNDKDYEKIADTTMGTYVDKSLKYGQTYYYKVKFSNRFYKGIESDTVVVTTENKWFNGLTPVDLGEQFDSYIKVKKANLPIIADEKNNAVIHIEEGSTSEMWRFIRQTDGSYKIQNFTNGYVLDAYASQTANGTNVSTHESHSGENQKWFIYEVKNGYVIRAAYTDKVLDVSEGNLESGSNIQLYEKNDTDSQIFELYTGESKEYGKPQVDTISTYVRGTSVILTLNTPSYIDTVKIYRSYDKKKYEVIGETIEGTYKDEELDDNQKYYYKAVYSNNFYTVESPVVNAITGDAFIDGDVNGDDELSIADVVLFQKWLLTKPNAKLVNWKAGDLCEDGKLNVFDLCLMRRKLIYG